MKLYLLGCEVFLRELCFLAAQSPHEVDVRFLPKGLHDLGACLMRGKLQEALAQVPANVYDAVLLGYGLCNNGLHGLEARDCKLVLPRAHDCITLFMGSRERYTEYFFANPGTYFLTPGWLERGESTGELRQMSIEEKSGMNKTYEELAEEYGEDNAEFLWEQLVDTERHYKKIAYIETGVCNEQPFIDRAKARADERGWEFERVRGDRELLRRLVDGEWQGDDFLVVEPGHRIHASPGEAIVKSVPVG